MAIEECGELIVSLSHFKRGRSDLKSLAEEIADVTIMLDQLKLIVGADIIADAIERKFVRLEERVRNASPTLRELYPEIDQAKLAEALNRDASGVYDGGDGDSGREGS
jgi:NTP pyrophosphatase (non-canonical NTP hydrolase)